MGGVSPTYDCSFFHRIIIVALFVPKLPLESPTRPIVATSIVIAVCGTNSNSIRNNLPPVEFAMPLFPLVVLATDGLIFSRFQSDASKCSKGLSKQGWNGTQRISETPTRGTCWSRSSVSSFQILGMTTEKWRFLSMPPPECAIRTCPPNFPRSLFFFNHDEPNSMAHTHRTSASDDDDWFRQSI